MGRVRVTTVTTRNMNHPRLLASLALPAIAACSAPGPTVVEVLLTSEAGDRIARVDGASFEPGSATGTVIAVDPRVTKQTIVGIGSSFTESSAFVLAHLDPKLRQEVMRRIYSADGANFSLTRTHIGACDFCVDGKYSYADSAKDAALATFSIDHDTAGFSTTKHPGIRDSQFDLLPMIREALAIKQQQDDRELKIIASAWTAPVWMKDIETWFVPGSAANNWQGTGGWLKPEHVSTYADYLVKYLDAYEKQGIDIWALTPVNEPNGNGGNWESMHFSPESQNDFVKLHLGPRLEASGHGDTEILVYDQNRDDLEHWTDVIFGDPKTAQFVHGVAVHWYDSTFQVYEDAFERVHAKFPEFAIIHTEGCIDNLGNAAPGGIRDPEGYREENWFRNDAFWWNANATDWAYSAEWADDAAARHPKYTPVHRYARNIIVSLDHWVSGWVDWNVVLDAKGGPNHANNFCGAPIMIDTLSQDVYYTPVYWVLAQFSRTIRPGDRVVQTERTLGSELDSDALHACATIDDAGMVSVQVLNTTKQPIEYALEIDDRHAAIRIPANSVQTVRISTNG